MMPAMMPPANSAHLSSVSEDYLNCTMVSGFFFFQKFSSEYLFSQTWSGLVSVASLVARHLGQ